MKLNRWMALILMTSLVAALFIWSLAHTRAHKFVHADRTRLLRAEDTGLILTGTLFPMVTTPIVGAI